MEFQDARRRKGPYGANGSMLVREATAPTALAEDVAHRFFNAQIADESTEVDY